MLLPEIAFANWAQWRPAFHAAYVLIARQDHPDLRAAGVATTQAMPVELYCRLRHAAFRVTEAQPEHQAMALSALGLVRRVILSVPTFAAVWRAVAATDMVGILPRRMALQIAKSGAAPPYTRCPFCCSPRWHALAPPHLRLARPCLAQGAGVRGPDDAG